MTFTGRAVTALMLREMATSYGRSPGGYLWAFLEPIAGLALLTLVLSMAFAAPPLGSSFALYYASGLVPFLFYIDISTKVSQSINFSRPLLGYPAVTFTDALLARFIMNYLVQISVALTIFLGVLVFSGSAEHPDISVVAQAFSMLGAFGLGVGTLNCFLLTRFPIWQRIWSILNRPLFVISCIFFTFESIPATFQPYLWWNPLVHIVGKMRDGFFGAYTPTFVSPGYVFLVSMALIALGLIFLRRFHQDLIEA